MDLGRVRITKNATQVLSTARYIASLLVCAKGGQGKRVTRAPQSSGISLALAAASADSLPQNFALREQTESITPTVVFADLQGRLSEHRCAPLLHALCMHAGLGCAGNDDRPPLL